MAQGFRILEHTADVGVAACGEDLREAFANAARGLTNVIADLEAVQEREERRVQVSAPDLEGLLVAWLGELIYLFDVEHLLFRRFQITELTDTSLTARCFGEQADPARHRVKMGVKAATYHQLQVVSGPPSRIQVYLDI